MLAETVPSRDRRGETPEGKAIAALNAVTHGPASARAIVLPEEDRPAFQLSLETGLSVDRLDDLREHLEIDPPEPDPADSSADQQFDENTSLLGALSGNAVPATTS